MAKTKKRSKSLADEEEAVTIESLPEEKELKKPKKEKSKRKDNETIVDSTKNGSTKTTKKLKVFVPSDLLPSVHGYLLQCGYSKSASYLLKEAGPMAFDSNKSAEDLLNVYTFFKSNQGITNDSPSNVEEINHIGEDVTHTVETVPSFPDAKKTKKARKIETVDVESTLSIEKEIDIETKPIKSAIVIQEAKSEKIKSKVSKDKKKDPVPVEVVEIKVVKPKKKTEAVVVVPQESSDSGDSSDDSSEEGSSDESEEEDNEEEEEEDDEQRLQRKETERRLKAEEATKAAEDWAHRANLLGGDSAKKSGKKSKRSSEDGEPRLSGEAFRRVDGAFWGSQIVTGLEDNSYEKQFGEDGYGAKASKVLQTVRGKDFRHEKTKKKRGSYRGGEITLSSNSFKYDD